MKKGEIWFNKDFTIIIGDRVPDEDGEETWNVAPFGYHIESEYMKSVRKGNLEGFHYSKVSSKAIRTNYRKYWGQ